MTERIARSFHKERTESKPIKDGSWETILVSVKTVLPLSLNETMGPGDSDFWIEIEDKATMTPKEACMDFYIHGIGHRTLADVVVSSFRSIRSDLNLDKDRKRAISDKVANRLMEFYPPKYRAKFGK